MSTPLKNDHPYRDDHHQSSRKEYAAGSPLKLLKSAKKLSRDQTKSVLEPAPQNGQLTINQQKSS